MNNEREVEKYKIHAVDKYLEQVKILTTFASALLLSPSFVLALLRLRTEISFSDTLLHQATTAIIGSSVSFGFAIILTYLIYSSIIGDIYKGRYDLNRLETRIFSIMQFVFVIIGCCFFVWFIYLLLRA